MFRARAVAARSRSCPTRRALLCSHAAAGIRTLRSAARGSDRDVNRPRSRRAPRVLVGRGCSQMASPRSSRPPGRSRAATAASAADVPPHAWLEPMTDRDVARKLHFRGVGALEPDAFAETTIIGIRSARSRAAKRCCRRRVLARLVGARDAQQQFGPAATQVGDVAPASGSSVAINSVARSDDMGGALKSSSVYQERSAESCRHMCTRPPGMMESPSWMSLRCSSNSTVVFRRWPRSRRRRRHRGPHEVARAGHESDRVARLARDPRAGSSRFRFLDAEQIWITGRTGPARSGSSPSPTTRATGTRRPTSPPCPPERRGAALLEYLDAVDPPHHATCSRR